VAHGPYVAPPMVDFTDMFMRSFYMRKSQKRKKTVKSLVSFCDFWICACMYKLHVKCWWN
jgi:hypothetical protein